MVFVEREIASQPGCWRMAAELAPAVSHRLPQDGARVLVIGCGTSLYVAQAFAALRELTGHGETDAYPASEFPHGRSYEQVVVLSRSGTTTEVLDVLQDLGGQRTLAITADPYSPIVQAADDAIVLDFAEERSVVQTRFATTTLMLLRAHLGDQIATAITDAEAALVAPLPPAAANRRQYTFIGRGWAIGLAQEAALKMREAAGVWAEAYPALEYRHGPISLAGPETLVWALGRVPADLIADIERTGASVEQKKADPLAELVRVQRLAVDLAVARDLDPDHPRHLSRSVILTTNDRAEPEVR